MSAGAVSLFQQVTRWKHVKLRDVCELINGRAYSKAELLSNGKYPVLRVGNFFSNRNWYYSDLELGEDKYCHNGDLLYAWSASFGPRIWNGDKVIFHYHIWNVKIDAAAVDKFFLYYWFEWDKDKIRNEHGAGTTMIHVTKKSMEEREICIPEIEEQKRIVAILDDAFERIDTAIANTEKNISNAQELFESYRNEVMNKKGDGWRDFNVGDVCRKVEYGTAAKSSDSGDVPVLRMGNIQNGRIDWSDLVYTSESDDIERLTLVFNDVLFNRTNSAAHVGKAGIYKGERKAIFAGYLIRIHRREDLIDADFLNYYLNSYGARDYGRKVMSKSVNQANINGTKLKAYPIALPSLKEQEEIVRCLVALEGYSNGLLRGYERKKVSLIELKQSLLQKAFSGELTADFNPNALEC